MTQQPVADPSIERSLDPPDWTAFRSLSHRMLDLALDHMRGVCDRRADRRRRPRLVLRSKPT